MGTENSDSDGDNVSEVEAPIRTSSRFGSASTSDITSADKNACTTTSSSELTKREKANQEAVEQYAAHIASLQESENNCLPSGWIAASIPCKMRNTGKFRRPDEEPPIPDYKWNGTFGVWVPSAQILQETSLLTKATIRTKDPPKIRHYQQWTESDTTQKPSTTSTASTTAAKKRVRVKVRRKSDSIKEIPVDSLATTTQKRSTLPTDSGVEIPIEPLAKTSRKRSNSPTIDSVVDIPVEPIATANRKRSTSVPDRKADSAVESPVERPSKANQRKTPQLDYWPPRHRIKKPKSEPESDHPDEQSSGDVELLSRTNQRKPPQLDNWPLRYRIKKPKSNAEIDHPDLLSSFEAELAARRNQRTTPQLATPPPRHRINKPKPNTESDHPDRQSSGDGKEQKGHLDKKPSARGKNSRGKNGRFQFNIEKDPEKSNIASDDPDQESSDDDESESNESSDHVESNHISDHVVPKRIRKKKATNPVELPDESQLHPNSMWEEPYSDDLTLYERHRTARPIPKGTILFHMDAIRPEIRCAICLDILQNTRIVRECLHRFCEACIEQALTFQNVEGVGGRRKECPICRVYIPSRRSLAPDPQMDTLISRLLDNLIWADDNDPAIYLRSPQKSNQGLMPQHRSHNTAGDSTINVGSHDKANDGVERVDDHKSRDDHTVLPKRSLIPLNDDTPALVKIVLIQEADPTTRKKYYDDLQQPFLTLASDAPGSVLKSFICRKLGVFNPSSNVANHTLHYIHDNETNSRTPNHLVLLWTMYRMERYLISATDTLQHLMLNRTDPFEGLYMPIYYRCIRQEN